MAAARWPFLEGQFVGNNNPHSWKKGTLHRRTFLRVFLQSVVLISQWNPGTRMASLRRLLWSSVGLFVPQLFPPLMLSLCFSQPHNNMPFYRWRTEKHVWCSIQKCARYYRNLWGCGSFRLTDLQPITGWLAEVQSWLSETYKERLSYLVPFLITSDLWLPDTLNQSNYIRWGSVEMSSLFPTLFKHIMSTKIFFSGRLTIVPTSLPQRSNPEGTKVFGFHQPKLWLSSPDLQLSTLCFQRSADEPSRTRWPSDHQ